MRCTACGFIRLGLSINSITVSGQGVCARERARRCVCLRAHARARCSGHSTAATLPVACCMLSVVCGLSSVACCMLHVRCGICLLHVGCAVFGAQGTVQLLLCPQPSCKRPLTPSLVTSPHAPVLPVPLAAVPCRGASPVPDQMWEGKSSPGVDVAAVSPVPVQMWQGVSPVPGCRCGKG
jgi:hypothetical protein